MGGTSFDDFVRARGPHLTRIAYLLTRDRHHAEDLVQTALARSWFAWRRIDGDPEPYVRRVLVNVYASWRGRRWHGELPSGVLPEASADGVHVRVDDRDALWRALGRLTYQQRAVLVLRYYEDMTEAQIADALGIAPGTVKAHASRALAALRLDASLRAEVPSNTTAMIEGGPTSASGTEMQDRGETGRLAGVIADLADTPSIDATVGDGLVSATRGRVRQRRIQRAVAATTALALLIAAVIAILLTAGVRIHAAPPIDVPRVGEYYGGDRIVAATTASTNDVVSLTWTPTTNDEHFLIECDWPTMPRVPSRDEMWFADVFDGDHVVGSSPSCGPVQLREFVGFDPGEDRIGVPTTVTMRVVRGPETSADATPGYTGTMYLAVGEAVPLDRYPLPSRPASLLPVTCHGRALDQDGSFLLGGTLLGPDEASDATSVTLPAGSYSVFARSQTPGQVTVSVNGSKRWTFKFLDYRTGIDSDTGLVDETTSGSPVEILITPEYLTGDWYVYVLPGDREPSPFFEDSPCPP